MLSDRPVKKVVPARSKEAEKRNQALAAALFGSDSSSDDENIQDLCSTSDDDNANGKDHSARKDPARKRPLVEESTDLSSEFEDEESDLATSSASDSDEEESEEEE